MTRKRFNVMLDEAMYQALRQVAFTEAIALGELVRRAIMSYLLWPTAIPGSQGGEPSVAVRAKQPLVLLLTNEELDQLEDYVLDIATALKKPEDYHLIQGVIVTLDNERQHRMSVA